MLIGWREPDMNNPDADVFLHIHSQHIFEHSEYSINRFRLNIIKDENGNITYGAEVCKKKVDTFKFR